MAVAVLGVVAAPPAGSAPAARSASAAVVRATARLDSATLLMGYTTTLRLQVEQPAGADVKFPLLRQAQGESFIPLLGDSVEIKFPVTSDTVRIGADRIRVSHNLTIQAFDSGTYRLPEFEFIYGAEHGRSNGVELKVVPVKVKADDEISPLTSVQEPDELRKIPFSERAWVKWLARWWWAVLLGLALVAGLVWCIVKYRKEGKLPIFQPKPQIPPFDEARESLKRLKSRQLWQNGKEKEYYTGLTFIMRRYLSKEYGIPAMEMTSGQILKALKKNPDLETLRSGVRRLLDMSDFAKFAKVRPLPQDNEECYTITEDFIAEAHAAYLRREEVEARKNEAAGRKGEKNSVRKEASGSRRGAKSGRRPQSKK